MQKNDNRNLWLTMRVGRGTLSFAMPADDAEGKIDFEPYVVKSGISLAANLREAFGAANLLQQPPQRLRLVVDSPVLMVPIELFDQDEMEVLYDHAFTRSEQDGVCYNVLPDLNAVAVFSLNKDLKLVADDHFPTVKVVAAMSPVWRHLHQRSYTGNRLRLFPRTAVGGLCLPAEPFPLLQHVPCPPARGCPVLPALRLEAVAARPCLRRTAHRWRHCRLRPAHVAVAPLLAEHLSY